MSGLYKSGFTFVGMPAMFFMSGLVDVVDVLWGHNEVLYFIVRSKDKTGVLFSEEGTLLGQSINDYTPIPQPKMVFSNRGPKDLPWCLSRHGPQ